jgi:hemerythrin-like domain-containing protein
VSSDAIVFLKEEHNQMRKLFRQFEQAKDAASRGAAVTAIIEALTAHTYIENECMYPQVRKLLPDLDSDILESYEEHHVADLLTAELAAMRPTDEHFEAKATVLMENVQHHMEEEESEWFPKVRQGLGRKQLQELGEQLIALRKQAPTQPDDPKARKSARDAVTS